MRSQTWMSRFVIAFLPRSKLLLISWLQSSSVVTLEPKKIKFVTVSTFSTSVCHEVIGLVAMILIFWMLSFKPAFSLSLSHISRGSLVPLHFLPEGWFHLVYLRLLIFLLTILIPTCASSSLIFCMTYSAYKLNKQGDNIQPWYTPFPILNCCSMFGFNCCFLTGIQIS